MNEILLQTVVEKLESLEIALLKESNTSGGVHVDHMKELLYASQNSV